MLKFLQKYKRNVDKCIKKTYEPRHETSNNMVCATSNASDQPAHMRRAFASHLIIL